MVQPEILLIVLAAVAPALAAGSILVMAARPSGRAWAGMLVAFLWGAVVATSVASLLHDAVGARLPSLVGAARARFLLPVLIGPTVEELVKAAGFFAVALVAGRTLDTVRAAIVTGAAIGFGFTVAENASYYLLAAVQGGYEGLGRSAYLRGVIQGGNHAVFTAVVGASIGRARARGPRLVRATIGLEAAIGLHAFWNGIVAQAMTTVLCNAPAEGAACAPAPDTSDLLLTLPALEAAFLVPIVAALRWLARRAPLESRT
jgi:RsiW-degrading membrane proteinase PrsW (M82 family)